MTNIYSDKIHDIAYNNDASHIPSKIQTHVFLPEKKEEIKEIVQQAIKEKKKIICRWSGTNLVGNCLPIKDCFVIDMSKLNNIVSQKNNHVRVEPWVIWDILNEYLSSKNLFFPVVLWSHVAAQIGAMIATNGAGMRAIKYGKMEHRVEELEILTVNKEKKINIKTITWDDTKNFLWSEWILWIILEAQLKLTEQPKEKSIDFLKFDNLDEILNKVKQTKDQNNPQLSALEIINPKVATLLDLENKYYLLIEYENNTSWTITNQEEREKLRAKRDACYSVVVNAWFDQIEDPQVKQIASQKKLLQRFETNNIPVFWHIWTGILHPHFTKDQTKLIDEMYSLVQKLWWKVSWEHGIWIKKKKYLDPQQKSKFQNLKDKYDPNNIFGGETIL